MTIYNKTSLKTFFETGDVPGGGDYANFIDSCVNMAETAVQTVNGPLNPTELIAGRVSAGTGVFTGNLSVAGILSAGTLSFDVLTASAATFTGNVSIAGNVSATTGIFSTVTAVGNISTSAGSVYASAMRASNGLYVSTGIVSATGTAQATAAPLTFIMNTGAGVADGQTTGFLLLNNRAGLTQYIKNAAVSANLWPASECVINALATNAAFGMAANTSYTILHMTNSAYAVK